VRGTSRTRRRARPRCRRRVRGGRVRRLRRRPVRPVCRGRLRRLRGRVRLVRRRVVTCRRSSSRSSVLRMRRLQVRRRLRVRRSRLLPLVLPGPPDLPGLPDLPRLPAPLVPRRLRVAGCITPRRCSPTRASVARTRRVLRARPGPPLLPARPALRVLRVRCLRRRPAPRRRPALLLLPGRPDLLRERRRPRAAGCTMPRRCWRVRGRQARVRRSRPVLRGLPGCPVVARTLRRRPPGRTAIRSSPRGSRRWARGIRPCCVSVRPTAVSSS